MRVDYLGAAAFSLGIMLAGAGFAVTSETPTEYVVPGVEKSTTLVFDPPEGDPVVVAEPAPDCAADGPGCPQVGPLPGGNGDYGEIPLPAPIFALVAGIVALVGLGRRRRSD
jgi:hypothetical protein